MTARLAPVSASPPNQLLAENHRQFLAFLRRRVDNDATAEDILQDAYVKSLTKIDAVRDEESAIAWFYRVLRNALVDHYRRSGVEKTAYEHLERDAESSFEPELRQNICRCVSAVLPSLKPEYAEMVNAVEFGDRPIVDVAREKGLTANNATVRLHRARAALRRRLVEVCGACSAHGCLDCTCTKATPP